MKQENAFLRQKLALSQPIGVSLKKNTYNLVQDFLKEAKEKESPINLKKNQKFSYLFHIYGSAGCERMKVYKTYFQRFLEALVPHNFLAFLQMDENKLSDSDYLRLLPLSKEEQTKLISSENLEVSYSDRVFLDMRSKVNVREVMRPINKMYEEMGRMLKGLIREMVKNLNRI